uniref:Uncharacterized protein n=1 Tax=Rhinopithecus roxellana TaxID=61622 RepID=A0A2K6QTR3_RHIRO
MERRPSLAGNYQGRESWQFLCPGLGTPSSGEVVKSVFWRPLLGKLWNYRSGPWEVLSSIPLPRPTPTQSCPPCFSLASLSGSQEPAPPPFRGRTLSMWHPVWWGGRPQWRLSEAWSLPRALLGAAIEAKKAVLLVLALLEVVLKSGAADGRKETASDAGLPGPEQSVCNDWKSFFLWPPWGSLRCGHKSLPTPLHRSPPEQKVLTLQPVRKNPSA